MMGYLRKHILPLTLAASLSAHGGVLVVYQIYSNTVVVEGALARGPIEVALISDFPSEAVKLSHSHHHPVKLAENEIPDDAIQADEPVSDAVATSPRAGGVYGESEVDVPVRLLRQPLIKYPTRAYRNGEEGDVELFLLLDESGKVVSAEIVKGKTEDFNQAALAAAETLAFAPATKNGERVPVHIHWTCHFRLQD